MKHTALLALLVAFLAMAQHSAGNTITSCYSCYGINCQRTSLHQEQSCVDSLDYCVTIYEEAKVLYKGCSLEIPYELQSRCLTEDSCHKCNTNRCNNVGSAAYACVECDSSKDSNCVDNADSLDAVRCAVPTASNSYCYAKSSNNVVQRGCATTETEQQSCLTDDNCILCSPGDITKCNTVKIDAESNIGNRFIRFLR
ncbi:uncharacterized protein LOC6640700 [Drosophila willistoni]|nr:uncharacterized protein LOC6640700 [Drosophila willistoni]